jgi:hypothetical protein
MKNLSRIGLALLLVVGLLLAVWPVDADAHGRARFRVGGAFVGDHGFIAFGTPFPLFAPVPRVGWWYPVAGWRVDRHWRIGVEPWAAGWYGAWPGYRHDPRWYRDNRYDRPGYGYPYGHSWFDGYRPRVWVPGRNTPEGYRPGYWGFR